MNNRWLTVGCVQLWVQFDPDLEAVTSPKERAKLVEVVGAQAIDGHILARLDNFNTAHKFLRANVGLSQRVAVGVARSLFGSNEREFQRVWTGELSHGGRAAACSWVAGSTGGRRAGRASRGQMTAPPNLLMSRNREPPISIYY